MKVFWFGILLVSSHISDHFWLSSTALGNLWKITPSSDDLCVQPGTAHLDTYLTFFISIRLSEFNFFPSFKTNKYKQQLRWGISTACLGITPVWKKIRWGGATGRYAHHVLNDNANHQGGATVVINSFTIQSSRKCWPNKRNIEQRNGPKKQKTAILLLTRKVIGRQEVGIADDHVGRDLLVDPACQGPLLPRVRVLRELVHRARTVAPGRAHGHAAPPPVHPLARRPGAARAGYFVPGFGFASLLVRLGHDDWRAGRLVVLRVPISLPLIIPAKYHRSVGLPTVGILSRVPAIGKVGSVDR